MILAKCECGMDSGFICLQLMWHIVRYNLLNDFLHINLQGLRTPGMAQRELDDLAEKGIQVVLGVATIPSTPPASPREEYVFNIAKLLLEQPYKSEGSQDEHLRLPNRRPLADMLNSVSGCRAIL